MYYTFFSSEKNYINSAINLDYCRIYINFAAKIGGIYECK